MHPFLKDFSVFSWPDILSSEEKCISFLQAYQLIPKKEDTPPCPLCGGVMSACSHNRYKLGYRWLCRNRNSKIQKCKGSINPLEDTFFEDVRISFRDVLAIIFAFVHKWPVTSTISNMQRWRSKQGEKTISKETVCDFYGYCREVAEVFASHFSELLGGPGKTIELDETFLTKWKFKRGGRSRPMTIVIFGIYCREDKNGLFFRVNSKKKRDLWPLVKKHCHPETSVVCTDSALQYSNVEVLFDDAIHKTTNHKIGEFVSQSDKSNTINSLENQNKLLKKAIISRHTDRAIDQYMALHFYRRTRLDPLPSYGEQVH